MHLENYRPQIYPPIFQPHIGRPPYDIGRVPHDLGRPPYDLGRLPYGITRSPYGIGQQPIGQPIHLSGKPSQPEQPEHVQSQVIDKTCESCIINIKCGGKDCTPTRAPYTQEPTIWSLPTLLPTQTLVWTFTTKATQVPQVTQAACRSCPCYMSQQCQICPTCK